MSFKFDFINNGVNRFAGEKDSRFYYVGTLEELIDGVWTPVDITGQFLEFIVRDSVNSAILITMDNGNGYALVTDGSAGQFTLDVPASGYTFPAGNYKCQLDMFTDAADRRRMLEGLFQQTEDLNG
jgi:hypothetical protein